MLKAIIRSLMAGVPLLFLSINVVMADSISSGVYYQTSVYVAAEWTGPGNWTSPSNSTGLITYDGYDDTKYISSLVMAGTLNGADVTISWYNAVTNSSDQLLSSTYLGAITITQSMIGTKISSPYSNANALNMQVTQNESNSGQVRVSDLYGAAYDLTGTSSSIQGDVSSGHIVFSAPSWWGNDVTPPATSPPTTTPITTVSGANIVNVYSVQTPPDWTAIEQGTADDIINDIPPVTSPPSGSNAITVSSQLSIAPPEATQIISTPPVNNVPAIPPETGATNFDFSDAGDTSAIAVPTTDSKPFTITDPMAGLTFSTSIPVPGSAPDSSMVPVIPGGSTPVPTIAVPVPSSGPSYIGSTALMGSIPVPEGAASTGGGPVPALTSPATITTPTPSPGGSESVPLYSAGGASSPIPLYNYSP